MNLRDIVDAATPGPWELRTGQLRSVHPAMQRAGADGSLMYLDGSGWEHDGDLEFIATFDPTTVGLLLDVIDAARTLSDAVVVGLHPAIFDLRLALSALDEELGLTEVTA